MTDEKLKDHIQRLNNYYLELKKISGYGKEEFLNNYLVINATERLFQVAIESCINIGNRIISLEQFATKIKSPETYSDIFRELNRLGVIDKDFTDTLIKMTKFRNRIVHLYLELEPSELYNYLQNNIDDFPKFISSVLDYFKKKDNKNI